MGSEEPYLLCDEPWIRVKVGREDRQLTGTAKVLIFFHRMGCRMSMGVNSSNRSYLLVGETQRSLGLVVVAKARACHAPGIFFWESKMHDKNKNKKHGVTNKR